MTTTVWPGLRPARVISMCQAVRNVRGKSRRFFEGQRGGKREEVPDGHGDLLGAAARNRSADDPERGAPVVESGETGRTLAAREAGRDDDPVARLEAAVPAPKTLDDAGDVAPGNVREGRPVGPDAFPEQKVQVVQGAGPNGDDGPSRIRDGIGGPPRRAEPLARRIRRIGRLSSWPGDPFFQGFKRLREKLGHSSPDYS